MGLPPGLTIEQFLPGVSSLACPKWKVSLPLFDDKGICCSFLKDKGALQRVGLIVLSLVPTTAVIPWQEGHNTLFPARCCG